MERVSMDCKRVEREDIVDRYLTGALEEKERKAFEAHCSECPACLEKLEISRTLQSELWEQSPAAVSEIAEIRYPRSGRWAYAVAAAVLIVAIGLALWWYFGPMRSRGVSVPGATVDIADLGRFEPPAYLPPPAPRGSADEASEYFERGMKFFQEGDYHQAIPDLETAVRINPEAAKSRFFLGICFLLTEQNKRGIKELKKTIALGDPAFAEEAHFYLAKAYLRQKDIGLARRELQAVVEARGRLVEEASRLLKLLE
jgi:tetratricopeptide (TPR) repeat protein